MTPEGYKIVCDALAADPDIAEFRVRPEPQPGEDVKKVDITIPGDNSAPIHRALGAAGLKINDNPSNPNPNAPQLAFYWGVVPQTRDKVTVGFRDRKVA